jgi:type IV pilus assembly protein PilW
MTALSHNLHARQVQRGVTLIEIMIALVVGLILTGGILQVFASSQQTNRVHEAISRMQETGRMALEVISRDARMADFWGCAADIGNVTNNLNSAGAGYIDFAAGGIDGTEGAAGAPDTLVFRGGESSGLNLEPPYGPQASSNVKVTAGNDLERGDIVLLSDCESADIFQITNANPGGSGTVVHNTGNTVSPGNYNATNPGCPGGGNAHCLSKVYGADATLFRTTTINYNLGPGSEGEPALFRNGLEFLDGVENLQVLYGEDTNGDGVANYYVNANDVVDMNRVISLRFAVVVRSSRDRLTNGVNQTYSLLGANVTAPDTRLRQVYSTTVTIRNRL